jgi:hypothetical protein
MILCYGLSDICLRTVTKPSNQAIHMPKSDRLAVSFSGHDKASSQIVRRSDVVSLSQRELATLI